MPGFKKIAHRGASGKYPENTRLAFVKAVEAGADMIELDCQLSRDGHVVVFHDERLSRLAKAKGTVSGKTLAELKTLDVGAWRKKSFKGERILTLEETLECIDGKADLCLEIKSYDDTPPGIELKILFIVSRYDYLERTVISSFSSSALARVRELAPDATLGLIVGGQSPGDPLARARALGAKSIHVQKELASREFLNRAWEEGFDVFVWTVNELRDMEALAGLGVQGLISDFPEKFARLRNG
jgi:glycerophosphoryl diester phosphodiesterase